MTEGTPYPYFRNTEWLFVRYRPLHQRRTDKYQFHRLVFKNVADQETYLIS
jgi:hypothetical protein